VKRGWAFIALAVGLGVWTVTAATFLLELPDHDIAEGIGLLAFVIGLFLVWEGGFTLWRARAIAFLDKPK